YWSDVEDHVIWTVETKAAGNFDVWIYHACDDKNAGNTLAVSTGKSRFTHKVASTGSWDEYRGERIGALQLAAGTQEIVFRSAGTIRGAMVDLKKVELSPR